MAEMGILRSFASRSSSRRELRFLTAQELKMKEADARKMLADSMKEKPRDERG